MIDKTPPDWPEGTLLQRRAIFVYEGARMQAMAANAPIVPEPWSLRDAAFRNQFRDIITKQCGPDRFTDPKEAHDSWWRKYEEMGWVYGEVRDADAKTHPDMVPFDQLDPRERDKDAVFLVLCDIARLWIIDHDTKEITPKKTCSKCHRERTLGDPSHLMDAYDYSPMQVATGQPLGWYSHDDGEICPECMTSTLRDQ